MTTLTLSVWQIVTNYSYALMSDHPLCIGQNCFRESLWFCSISVIYRGSHIRVELNCNVWPLLISLISDKIRPVEQFGPIWRTRGLEWEFSWHRQGLTWINVTNIFTLILILFRINQKAAFIRKIHPLGCPPNVSPSLTAILYGTLVIINRPHPYYFQSKVLGKLFRLLGKMTDRKLAVDG